MPTRTHTNPVTIPRADDSTQEATLKSVASAKGVPNRLPRCHNLKAGWTHCGPSLGSEACWLDGGKANYRLITSATGC